MPDPTSPAAPRSVRDLPPNIFAVVMATGIVALAVNAAGWPAGGHVLFWVGVAAYAVLWVLTAARCARHWPVVRADLTSHARGPGFFTVVAATGVLGNGCVLLHDSPGSGLALWAVALVLWAGLSYTILPGLIESEHKPELEKGLSGVWLLTVVATQAVCVLGCLVIPHLPGPATGPGLFAVLCFWLVGGMLYLWLIALIFYRVMFRPLAPADLTPPYWINMGAVAISTLGGVSLVAAAPGSGLLVDLLPFLKGLTLMFWATATWWLPLLLMLGVWRHGVKGYPLTYDHGYWGAVFPLGMYAVCTFRLAREFGLPFLTPIGDVFAWVALAAWAATAVGLARRLIPGLSASHEVAGIVRTGSGG
ncbi:MAG TPA: tellurite resistance/C4-dicarboxylate transporter family protein [Gemmataceae bacterium]|nr:tellurite resistance/C4-dicarboxylate transporter family protein [Gemmataceae bacterium]